jgi:hypothetical protein
MTIKFSDYPAPPAFNLGDVDVNASFFIGGLQSNDLPKSDIRGYMERELIKRLAAKGKDTASDYEAYAKKHHVDANKNIDMAMFVAWLTDTPIAQAQEFQLWRTGNVQQRACIAAIRRFFHLHEMQVTNYKTIREPIKLIRSFPVSFEIKEGRIASEHLKWLEDNSWLIVRDKRGMSGRVK